MKGWRIMVGVSLAVCCMVGFACIKINKEYQEKKQVIEETNPSLPLNDSIQKRKKIIEDMPERNTSLPDVL